MANPSSAPQPVRILLVDDNLNGLTARRTLLEELGYKITTAPNAAEALEHIGRHKFDLVVTDYKMPRMDGIEFIRHLRKEVPGIPVVLISGFVDALGLNEETTGADAVIQKSANEVTLLVRTVARLLRRRKGPDSAKPKAKRRAV
jgi:CheY-like chemotaxis protein